MSAPVRLVVVGQQTHGWDFVEDSFPPDDAVDRLMGHYRDFNLSIGTELKGTPFWVYSHKLNRALNGSGRERCFVWTNLFKVDSWSKNRNAATRPGADVERILRRHFNVLPLELKLLRPQVLVFFTGPNCDDEIQFAFPGVRFAGIAETGERSLARLSHPSLPELTFRTYHPKHLNLKWQDLLPRLLRAIRDDLPRP